MIFLNKIIYKTTKICINYIYFFITNLIIFVTKEKMRLLNYKWLSSYYIKFIKYIL